MAMVTEGIYHNGFIKINNILPFKENDLLKILIIEKITKKMNLKRKKLNTYKLGKKLDNINLRDFAYE